MGNKLFGVNISGIIAKAIGPGVLAATLIKVTPGTRTTGSLGSGTNPTEVSYTCRGFIDTQAQRNVDGTLAADGTKRIVLIGDTISGGTVAPALGDKITIEGATYRIPEDGKIDRDPAAATYSCKVRLA